MHRRQPLPRLWLMTDERQGDALWQALRRLPRGAGVIFRHYSLGRQERAELLRRVKAVARRKQLLVIVGGVGHGRRRGSVSAPVHNLREIRAAERAGARILFLSPVFATHSHPRARTLGPLRFGLLARQTRLPVIALGGMNARNGRHLMAAGAYGWAGIDAWSGDQKRKAVPM